MDLKTRYVGTCPVCQAQQKLAPRPGAKRHGALPEETLGLVHHGYRRPGDGAIHSDCFGVGYEPYEQSTRGCEAWRRLSADTEQMRRAYLAKLEAGEIRTLYVEKYAGWGKTELVKVSADSGDPRERRKFEDELDQTIRKVKHEIEHWVREQERMTRLIDSWVKQPIITFEEHAEQVRAATAAKRAEREQVLEAKRAVKRARQAALEAKKGNWAAEQSALIAKYRGLLRSRAVESDLERAKRGAREDWWNMHKAKRRKGYLDFYPSELDADDALITLGLARRDGDRVRYADQSGVLW